MSARLEFTTCAVISPSLKLIARVLVALKSSTSRHRAIEHHFRKLLAGSARPASNDLLAHYQAEWQERDVYQVRLGRDVNL